MNRKLRCVAVGLAATLWGGAMAQNPAPAPSAPPAAPAAPAAEPAPPPPPPPPAQEPTQKIGKEIKLAMGKVLDIERQDNGCLINFVNDKKQDAIELALPEFCVRKPPLKGQTLHFIYKMMTVLADECLGNPRCKKMEERPVIVEANPLK
ncbi:MAG: hypothetical protein JNK75_09955 [Betaproteobacteria bacterium]|nr:hypothetical protein [Betaproteobacteria bacterium]